MKRTKIMILLFSLSAVTLVVFQNCTSGFQSDPVMAANSASPIPNLDGNRGASPTPSPTPVPHSIAISFIATSDGSTVLPQNILASAYYQVVITGATGAHIVPSVTSNTANCSVNASLILTCANAGAASISLNATYTDGGTASTAVTLGVGPAADPNLVTFHIASGTGVNAYNTSSNYVLAFVGQTVRIFNDDAANHQLQTAGSPCAAESSPIATGASFDCVVGSAHEDINAGDVYDYLVGTTAPFFIKTIDGAAKYAANCASCHGPLATSTRKGATYLEIVSAKSSVPEMSGITLSDDELKAIAYSLDQ